MRTAALQAEPSVAAYAVPLLQARAVSVPSLTLSFAAIGAFRCCFCNVLLPRPHACNLTVLRLLGTPITLRMPEWAS